MKNKVLKKIVALFVSLALFFGFIAFWLYGPIDFFRDLWVTSAMTTYSRQWLATGLYSQSTIDEIMNKNTMKEVPEKTDPSLIQTDSSFGGFEVITIQKPAFKAKLIKIYDPSLVRLALPPQGQEGAQMYQILKNENAIAGINGSGFYDKDGHSSGGRVLGLLIKDGVKLNDFADPDVCHIVGIDYDNKLRLGYYLHEEIAGLNLRDCVEFYPYLIVNGKKSEIVGNGGYGLAPRSAIGQREDGTFLFLCVDGRQLSSIGASMKDLQDIMAEYGAVNAANLDGGSSAIMMFEGKTVSTPCTSERGRYLPNAFVAVDPDAK